LNEVIADVPQELPHVRVPKTPEGAGAIDALVAESVYAALAAKAAPVDFSIINAGGVRSGVSAGQLTAGFVLGTLLPFEQTLVSMNLRGEDVRRVLEDAVDLATANGTGIPASSGAFPYVGHLTYTYDGKKPKGARLVKLERRKTDGTWEALVDGAIYRVATLQYLSLGKDGFAGMLARMELPNQGDFVDSDIQVNLGFIEFAKAQKTLVPLPYATVIYLAP
jgi:5'-nucleotidase